MAAIRRPGPLRRAIEEMLVRLEEASSDLHLRTPTDALSLLRTELESGKNLPYWTLHERLQDVRRSFARELKSEQFYHVPADKLPFLIDGQGDEWEFVMAAFPSLSREIRDARSAYAFELYTACMFYLMRIAEFGLRQARDHVIPVPANNPNWGAMLRELTVKLSTEEKARTAFWRQDGRFYSGVRTYLEGVRQIVRNPTMHIQSSYDEKDARDMLHQVRIFMAHLATRLKE